jgi:putative membrane protein
MMWGSQWGWGGWLVMLAMMVLFWGLIVAGVIVLACSLGGPCPGRSGPDGGRPSAEEILAERFARGEIDEEKYTRRRALRRSGR